MSPWKHAMLDRFAPLLLVLALILVLLLNSALITVLQTSIQFPYSQFQDALPEHYALLDAWGYELGQGQLIWENNQQWRLIIAEKHVKADRWRTVCDMVLTEQNFSGEFPSQAGKLSVQLEGYQNIASLSLKASPVYQALHVPAGYLLWNLGLLLLELTGFFLFRKLRAA